MINGGMWKGVEMGREIFDDIFESNVIYFNENLDTIILNHGYRFVRK